MALTPPLIYTDLVTLRASAPLPMLGFSFDQLAWAIAYGVAAWAPQVQLAGLAVGTAGAGTLNVVTTKVIVPPNPPLVIGSLSSAGLVGPLALSLGTIVGQAIPKTMLTYGQYTGAAVGVGNGADASKVVFANGPALTAILQPLLNSFVGPGPASLFMAQGLGTGIAALMLTGTGTGTVVGPPSPAPATGPTTSVLV